MKHRFATTIFLLLSFASPPWTPLSAQQSSVSEAEGWEDLQSFGEEIAVDVVNLEVWVTDEQGDPVTGLKKEDFEVYEDGEPVEVANFAAYGVQSIPEPEATAGAAETPPWEVAPQTTLEVSDRTTRWEAGEMPPEEKLYLTVLVDNWNIQPADRTRVFQDLRQFIVDNLRAGDRVAVAVNDRSLQLVQRFTDRPVEILRALDRIERTAPQGLQLRTERTSALREIEQAMRTAQEAPAIVQEEGGACSTAIGQMMGAAQRYASTIQGHVQSSAGGLATLAGNLAGVPGRRAILYVGNGLAQTPGVVMFEYVAQLCPNHRSELTSFQNEYDLSWLYEEVATRANAAGVTLYTMEAETPAIDLGLDRAGGGAVSGTSRGARRVPDDSNLSGLANPAVLQAAARGGPSGRRFQPSTAVQRIGSQDQESSLVLMAQQTGGRSFLNAADFAQEFDKLARDLRSYYSLGFTPADPGDGELHRLEVKLADGREYRVRHRLRYRDKPMAERMAERVRGVAQFGTEVNPLDVTVEVGDSFPTDDGSFRVAARLWIPFERMTLIEAEGDALQGRIRVLMATTDAGGQLLPVRQKVVPLDVSVPEGARRPPGEHLVEIQLTLPAGDHHVALAVRDDLGGETSYLRERFRVPTTAMEARKGER